MRRRRTSDGVLAAASVDSDLLMTAGGRLGRDSVIYGVAIGMALPFGLASVVVYTRYLDPSEYGHLALLLVASGALTLLYNLPTLMGTIALAYGAGADEDVDDDATAARGTRSGETLATGLALTLLVAGAATLALLALAPRIATSIAGPELTPAVRWALLSAAAGAAFRLVVNVPRIENRALLYTLLSTLRPAFALAVGTVLVVSGRGAQGVVCGLAVGTAAAAVVALLVTLRSYAPRLAPDLVPEIWRHSRRMIAMVASTWTLHNVDLIVLSRYAGDATVGSYRVANRLAAFVLYAVSAFLMAMGPVRQTSLFKAADDRTGQLRVTGLLVRYFAIGGVYVVLLVALGADALFLLAAPAYRDATSLVTLMAAGFMTYGLARVFGRTVPVPRRGTAQIRAMSVTAAAFVPLCFVLASLAGTRGAAAAMIVAMVGLCCWWAARIARSEQRLQVGWRPILTATAVAGGGYALSTAIPLGDGWKVAGDAAIALLVVPALLVASGAVPARHVRPLRSIVASALAPGRRADAALVRRLRELDGADLVQVRKGIVIRRSGNADQMARGIDLARFVAVLRRLAQCGEAEPHDRQIGAHLVLGGSYAEVQARAEALRTQGVDPTDLYRLEDVFRRTDRLIGIG